MRHQWWTVVVLVLGACSDPAEPSGEDPPPGGCERHTDCPADQNCLAGRCVPAVRTGCGRDGDCADSTGLCDVTTRRCIECRSDLECQGFATRPYCDPASSACVPCFDDSHCVAPQRCHPEQHTCVDCVGHRDCTAEAPVCEPGGDVCIQCQSDAHCPAGTPNCDTLSNSCYACTSDADCWAPYPRCNLADGSCSGCSSDAECPAERPTCSLASGACTGCLSDTECTAPRNICDLDAGDCLECQSNADCPPAKPVCDGVTGYCFQCVDNGDCAGRAGTPFCDALNRICIQCLASSDCSAAGATVLRCADTRDYNNCDADCLATATTSADCPGCLSCVLNPANFCLETSNSCTDCLQMGGRECPAPIDPDGSGPLGAITFSCGYGSYCRPSPLYGLGADEDYWPDSVDNCPTVANQGQQDMDGDGLGDACDEDIDGDGWPNGEDNCALLYNPDQIDIDGNGWGDECQPAISEKLEPTCPSLGYPTATSYFDGFDSGALYGWVSQYGSFGGNGVWGAPEFSATAAHDGPLGLYFPQTYYPSSSVHAATLLMCMPLDQDIVLSLWVKPEFVGDCGGHWCGAEVTVSFINAGVGFRLVFTWSNAGDVQDSAQTKHIRLDLGTPEITPWRTNQWNRLRVSLRTELTRAFGTTDFRRVVLSNIRISNHYSNGPGGAFAADSFSLEAVP